MKNWGRILLAVAVVGLIVSFFLFDLDQYLTLKYLKSQQDNFENFYTDNPGMVIYHSKLGVPIQNL